MADEFQAGGTCSGSWWSTARSGGFEGMALAASVSCSTSISDISGGGGGFSWAASELVEGKAVASDEAVGSSIAFQGIQKSPQVCDQMPTTGSMLDSTLQMAGFGPSSPTIDWNQTLLRSSGRSDPSFHAMLQESNRGQTSTEDISSNPFKDMNHGFMVDQQHLSSSNEPGFPLVPASYGCPSALLQGLLEPDNKPQQPLYHENRGVNYHQPPIANYHVASTQPLWARFPQLLKGSPAKQPTSNQLQFSNNTPFWNASTGAATEPRSSFYSPVPAQFGSQPFAKNTSLNCITSKSNPEGAGESSSVAKKGEPAFKKPRIETPSPLPTFKVRKEKLGDRITALQQLVSPFGKTDTASVLHEAIEYIKFLHDQVGVLSTPYLKNGHPMQHQQNSDKSKDGEGPKQDLRSRGLCLVPIASTYPVASETTADFWTPTFGGTYR